MNQTKTFVLLAAMTALFGGVGYLIGGTGGMLDSAGGGRGDEPLRLLERR